MHALDVPAGIAEFRREPVEQARMAGSLPLQSEIVRSRDEAPPEVLLPDPVDRDPRGQGVFGREEPARQVQAGGGGSLRRGQETGRRRAHLDAGPVPSPADPQEGRPWRRMPVHDSRFAPLRIAPVEFLEFAERFRKPQFLLLLGADDETVCPQEISRHHVRLPPGALGGRNADDLLASVRVQAEFLPGQVPVEIDARFGARFQAVPFPGGLQGGHVVRVQNLLAFPAVFVDGPQKRTQLARQRRVDTSLLQAIEIREEFVEPALRERVVLVVMALGAAHRQPEPDGAERAGPVDGLLEEVLRRIDPALAVPERIAVKPGRDPLFDRRVRQQVAGDLLDRELVEAHPSVEGVDHPPAVAPGVRPHIILGVPVGVRVARLIEPVDGLLLAEMLGSEQAVDNLPISRVAAFPQESALFFDRRRQAGQIERYPGQQRSGVGAGRRREPLLAQPFAHKVINRIPARRNLRPPDRPERPVLGFDLARAGVRPPFGPRGSLVDPGAQQADLLGGERLAGGRHDRLHAVARHHMDQAAVGRIARQDRRSGMPAGEGVLPAVKPQSIHRVGRTVASVAALLEQRLDLRREIHWTACRGRKFGG